jgi:hypothetical protein
MLYKAFFGPLRLIGRLIEFIGKVFKVTAFQTFGKLMQDAFSPCEKVG